MKRAAYPLLFALKWLEKQPESAVKLKVFLNLSPRYGIIGIGKRILISTPQKKCVCLFTLQTVEAFDRMARE